MFVTCRTYVRINAFRHHVSAILWDAGWCRYDIGVSYTDHKAFLKKMGMEVSHHVPANRALVLSSNTKEYHFMAFLFIIRNYTLVPAQSPLWKKSAQYLEVDSWFICVRFANRQVDSTWYETCTNHHHCTLNTPSDQSHNRLSGNSSCKDVFVVRVVLYTKTSCHVRWFAHA